MTALAAALVVVLLAMVLLLAWEVLHGKL